MRPHLQPLRCQLLWVIKMLYISGAARSAFLDQPPSLTLPQKTRHTSQASGDSTVFLNMFLGQYTCQAAMSFLLLQVKDWRGAKGWSDRTRSPERGLLALRTER